jgi:hyperosmotically inducible protein
MESNDMKTSKIVVLTLSAALAGPCVALAAESTDTDRDHPKEYVQDSAITTKIKAKLAAEHLGSLGNIHVDTDKDGVVWLSGTTHTREAMEKAVSIAEHTEHVRKVHNDISVKKDD